MTDRCFGIHPLSVLQGIAAFFPFILSFPLYFIIGCTHGFPKRVLLPMILFTVWSGFFFALPLPIFLGIQNTILVLSIAQPALGIMMLVILRYSGRSARWLHTQSDFSQLVFRWKRLFCFSTANVIIILPLLCAYLAVSLSLATSHFSRGFVHLGVRGIAVEARTYRYKGQKILLLPTFHIAKPSFYSGLFAYLPKEKTVVILEGITDKENLLINKLDHTKLARSLGLAAQDNRTLTAGFTTTTCDVDVSEFSSDTVNFLNTYDSIFQQWSSGNRAMALTKYLLIPEPDFDLISEELLELRNRRVTECIYDSLKLYDYVMVPWGAGHMPGLERDILASGAVVVERRRIHVWRWFSASGTAQR